jgi:8-amino-7-oxononanoate synthase
MAEATRTSLELVMVENWRRDKLFRLLAHFRSGAEQLGLPIMASASAIQPLMVGDSHTVVKWSNDLLEKGFLVSAIRPPTVPRGESRLRITFSADHEQHQVDQLLDALVAVTT